MTDTLSTKWSHVNHRSGVDQGSPPANDRHLDHRATPSTIHIHDAKRDLGIVIDSSLSLCDHVAAVYRSGYFHLRHLRPVVSCSSQDATKTMVQTSSRLDSSNARYYCITDDLMRRLQTIQNAATRLVTGTRQCDLISSTPAKLTSSAAARRVQGRHPCPPSAVWARYQLPGRRLVPRHRRSSKNTSLG